MSVKIEIEDKSFEENSFEDKTQKNFLQKMPILRGSLAAARMNYNFILEDIGQPLRGPASDYDKTKMFYWANEIERIQSEMRKLLPFNVKKQE